MQTIDWNFFTKEEQTLIQKAIDSGDKNNIVCLVDTVNMDPDKEKEIQKIINDMTPEDDNFVSEVEPELQREFLEKVPEPDKTPEQEAEWQKKLDEERKLFVEKKKKLRPAKKDKEEEIIINKEDATSTEEAKSKK